MNAKVPSKKKFRHDVTCTIAALHFFLGLCFFLSQPLSAQPFGDEWINTDQTYLRISISKTGFYKITNPELKLLGLPVEEVPPESWQIFRRGKEIAIEIKNEVGSEKMGQISFYAEKNDGTLDSVLYKTPTDIAHSRYSLYSDTAIYFLTWNKVGIKGKRIEKNKGGEFQTILNYHFEEVTELFTSQYSTGSFYPAGSGFETGSALSGYDAGEGWTGKQLNLDWQIFDLNTSNFVARQSGGAEVEFLVTGRSDGHHEMDFWIGRPESVLRKLAHIQIKNYESGSFVFSVKNEDLINNKFIISLKATDEKGSVSISYIKWRYPQKTVIPADLSQKEFHFEEENTFRKWQIVNAGDWRFFDCTDPYAVQELAKDNSDILVPGSSDVVGFVKEFNVQRCRIVSFRPLELTSIDYLIVSHPIVREPFNGLDPVNAYANYRSSNVGGSYKPLIIYADEVFDRFNYGEPGPHGIRHLISKLNAVGKPKFVFLIGRSTDPQTVRKLDNARDLDMIPNAGWPGSDLALSMGLNGSGEFIPSVPVGRINAISSEQVWNYLQKVKATEAESATAPWRKRILHLSGGRSRDERSLFRSYINGFEERIKGTELGASFQTLSKKTDADVEQFSIDVPVNEGVGLITLFGHSNIDVTDIDIGYASDDQRKYRNKPFFPAVIVNGCALGSIFYSTRTISTDWIFAPDKGAVLFLAHTFNGLSSSLKHYTDSFYDVLADPRFVSEPFGVIQKEAIRRNMLKHPTLPDGITAQQMNLHGDPAIRIFPARLPDYAIDLATVSGVCERKLTIWSDSICVKVLIRNNGRFRKEQYQIRLKNASKILAENSRDSFSNSDTVRFILPNPFKTSGEYTFEIFIDPDNRLTEESKINNLFRVHFSVAEAGAQPILPLPNALTNRTEIELVGQLPSDRFGSELVFEWDTTEAFSSLRRGTVPVSDKLSFKKIEIPDQDGVRIYWRVYLPEDSSRPIPHRTFTYSKKQIANPQLPEGIVLPISGNYSLVEEGEEFAIKVLFQNITDVAFSDSMVANISHTFRGDTILNRIKLPALGAKELATAAVRLKTIKEIGEHHLTVEFNASKLPEIQFTNNKVQFAYRVVRDSIPPILNVQVDGRQLADGDFVSERPIVTIQVVDENNHLMREDTTGIKVFLQKDCQLCVEEEVPLTEAQISRPALKDFRLQFPLTNTLVAGVYFLRVNANDISGNEAKAYQIRFKIGNRASITKISVSPNPSGQWFRFHLDVNSATPGDSVSTRIFDIHGRLIKHINLQMHTGENDWFWFPGNLPTGIYFYQMMLSQGNLGAYPDGNVALTGRLIWVR